jgi:hypothetical protein
MISDFVQKTDAGLSAQLNTFYSHLATLGGTLGFTQAEIDEAKADADSFAFMVLAHNRVKEYLKTVTTFKNDIFTGVGSASQTFPVLNLTDIPSTVVPDGIVTRFRAKAAKAKVAPAYTDAIGTQLGILGSYVADPDPATAKPPILGLSIEASKVILKWRKGTFDGIKIYRKVNDGAFEMAGVDIRPHWSDPRPLPNSAETWTYKIQYFFDDSDVGLFSDESSINVAADIKTL